MAKQRLTQKQNEQLQNLKSNGRLYVGNNTPSIKKIFDALVDKGCAIETETTVHGRYYKSTEDVALDPAREEYERETVALKRQLDELQIALKRHEQRTRRSGDYTQGRLDISRAMSGALDAGDHI